jgi:hypothetical protein
MASSIVWGGFEFGTAAEVVLAELPQARQRTDCIEMAISSFGADFDVMFEFDDNGLSMVKISFVRALSTTFDRLLTTIVHQISLNHGRGERRYTFEREYRKRWVDRDVVVNMLALDDPDLPVLCVEYSKSKIVDAQLWAYKNRI